jgi:suppressor of G2 allele of SKP1
MASPEQQQPDRIPFTWFQSPDKIEVNVMVKRRRPEQVTIRHETGRLECLVHSEPCPAPAAACSCAPGPATCSFELWGEVVSSSLEVDVLGSKVEIRLTKSRPGEPWPSLEKELEKEASSAAKPRPEKKEKNWDKIGDDDGDDEAGVDAMGFFQHLFAGADDDTRRAMMKSYVESNGTSLSTNWDDVKSKDFSKDV